jgi:hypothetical protein
MLFDVDAHMGNPWDGWKKQMQHQNIPKGNYLHELLM